MKKLFFIIIFISTIIVTGLAIMLLFSNEITDRFNPLVPKEEIYVQVNKDGHAKSPGGYDYTLIGYNARGSKNKLLSMLVVNYKKMHTYAFMQKGSILKHGKKSAIMTYLKKQKHIFPKIKTKSHTTT